MTWPLLLIVLDNTAVFTMSLYSKDNRFYRGVGRRCASDGLEFTLSEFPISRLSARQGCNTPCLLSHFARFLFTEGMTLRLLLTLLLVTCTCSLLATDLTIHLPESQPISRQNVRYRCDPNGSKIGVPSGPFVVEYINGGGNSLVVVPVSGNALIFSNVMAGSGARYTAQQYTWWEAGGSVALVSDSITGKIQSTCRQIARR